MAGLRALPYSRFIQVICLMGAYICPEKADGEFMIYQNTGTGYYPNPRGPQCAFYSRPKDELVTVLEIESVLRHLSYSTKVFIETEAACQVPHESISQPIHPPYLK